MLLLLGQPASRRPHLSASGGAPRPRWTTSLWCPSVSNEQWIARSADLSTRTSAFQHSVDLFHKIVDAHRGYFEDLRTESRSGFGRALAAALAVPPQEFDATLDELKTIGRVESISQAGEDSGVQLATAAGRLTAAQTNLARLQKTATGTQG